MLTVDSAFLIPWRIIILELIYRKNINIPGVFSDEFMTNDEFTYTKFDSE